MAFAIRVKYFFIRASSATVLKLGEEAEIADGAGTGQQHAKAIDTDADTTGSCSTGSFCSE